MSAEIKNENSEVTEIQNGDVVISTNNDNNETTQEVENNQQDSAVENVSQESNVETQESPVEKPAEPAMSDDEKNKIEEELKSLHASNTPIEVQIKESAIGGFRVIYKNYTLFMPISHVSVRKKPEENELEVLKQNPFEVLIQDIKDLNGSLTFVVSRRKLLEAKVWDTIKVGDELEGRVSSITTFGVFLDLGGIEGLVHISRLAKQRVNKASDFCKKGDILKAVILDIDKENKKISLSHQEFTKSPWEGVEAQFPKDSKHQAKVRRFTTYGAYLELAPGIEGLLRNGEISWTKRFKEPQQILKLNSTVEVIVKDINVAKENMALSIKALIDNPWNDLKDRFPVDSVYFAKVSEVNNNGVVFELNDEVDGFMPKSKIAGGKRNITIPYKVGESVEVKIAEIVPENESLILKPNIEIEQVKEPKTEKMDPKFKKSSKNNGFSLGELLSDAVLTDLNKIG
jgi:small subunit ribosomal protein S1